MDGETSQWAGHPLGMQETQIQSLAMSRSPSNKLKVTFENL